MRQQRLGAAGSPFDPLMAAFRELAVAGKSEVALRLGDIDEFLAGRVRSVERNMMCCHGISFIGLPEAWSLRLERLPS